MYQVDWSHGLAGWQASQGWKVNQGQLEANSIGASSVTIPYTPTTPDYAIEVRVQIVGVTQNITNAFTIFATQTTGKDGYQAGVNTLTVRSTQRPPAGYAQIVVNSIDTGSMPGQQFQQIDYVPGSSWHIYRVEIQGNEATLRIDGSAVSSSTSTEACAHWPARYWISVAREQPQHRGAIEEFANALQSNALCCFPDLHRRILAS